MTDRSHTRARRFRLLLAAALAVLCVAGAGGCKYTDVLTEHIEDPVNGVLDETQEPNYVERLGAPEDPTRKSTIITENDRIDEQEEQDPEFDEEAPDDEQTETAVNADTMHDPNAAAGTRAGGVRGTSEQTSQGGEGTDDQETSGGETDEVESDDVGRGTEQTGGDVRNAGTGGEIVVNSGGTVTEVPENVGTVAAAGQYATIVQMLSGAGGLVACDQGWKDRVTGLGAFPGEGVDALPAVWADGSDSSTLDVDALIAVHPDAVIVDGYESAMTQEQMEAVAAAGISVVTMPSLGRADTSDENITKAVTAVGELLADASTYYDAPAAASRYVEFHKQVLDGCQAGNGGPSYKTYNSTAYLYYYQGEDSGVPFLTAGSSNNVSTAVVDSWAEASVASVDAVRDYYKDADPLYLHGQSVDATDGVGIAVSGTGGFMLLDYYLQLSGVVNNSYETTKPTAPSEGQLSYPIIAGSPIGLFSRPVLTRERPSALWYKVLNSEAYDTMTVGDASFPGLLVRTAEFKDYILASAAKGNGLYNVGQPYTVWVIPEGLCGSWEYGSVESFLASAWAFGIYRPADADSWAAYTGYVEDFYTTFYRCSAGDLVTEYANQLGYTAGGSAGTENEAEPE